MLPAAPSTATDVEAPLTEDDPRDISHNSTRDSIVTVRLSDSISPSIPNEGIANDFTHECAIEDSAEMVDIRLSDPRPLESLPENEAPESPLEGFPQMDDPANNRFHDTARLRESSISILPEEVKVIQRIHRESIVSMLSAVDEGSSDTTSLSLRSRSDSSGTFSSLDSASVDWLELEKKEEEAPRDEASDEVGYHNSNQHYYYSAHFCIVDSIPSRQA